MSRYKMTLIPCSTDDRKVVNQAKFRNAEVAFSPYGRCILSGSSYTTSYIILIVLIVLIRGSALESAGYLF